MSLSLYETFFLRFRNRISQKLPPCAPLPKTVCPPRACTILQTMPGPVYLGVGCLLFLPFSWRSISSEYPIPLSANRILQNLFSSRRPSLITVVSVCSLCRKLLWNRLGRLTGASARMRWTFSS